MTVSQDLSTENVRTGTTSPQTFSHGGAASGVKAVAIAIVHGTSATDHVSAVSYGGVACQRIVRATDTSTEPGAAEIWFLGSGVPQGTQTVSYTPGATTDDIHCVCTTFLADADCIVIDFDSVSENAANPSVTLNYGGRSSLAYGALYGGGSAPSAFTPNGNCTAEHDHDLGAFYSAVLRQTTAGTSDFTIGGTAASDDVAFVAIAITEKVSHTLTAEQGSYTLSGQSISFSDTIHWTAGGPGPLPHIGLLLESAAAYTMPAAQGEYALGGQAAALRVGREIDPESGSYSLDGQTATLAASILATQGSYALSGQAATLRADRTLDLEQGEYSLDGQTANLLKGFTTAATQGSYTLDGQATALRADRQLDLDQGEYSLTGQDAGLSYDSADKILNAEQGSYALSGQDADLAAAHAVAPAQGDYELSGQDATFALTRGLSIEAGSYTLSGQAAALSSDAAEPEPQAPAKGGGNPGLTRKQFKEHLERIRRERAREVVQEVSAAPATTAGVVFVFAPITEPREAVIIPAPMKIRKSRRKKDEEELLRYGLLD